MGLAARRFGWDYGSRLKPLALSLLGHGALAAVALVLWMNRGLQGLKEFHVVSELSVTDSVEGKGSSRPRQSSLQPESSQLSSASGDDTGLRIPYPESARARGEHGTVHAEWIVSPEGRAIQIVVRDSSGSLTLDRAVVDGIERHRFAAQSAPGTQRAKFRFVLKGEE